MFFWNHWGVSIEPRSWDEPSSLMRTFKDWLQFLFGSWRNNLNHVVYTVQPATTWLRLFRMKQTNNFDSHMSFYTCFDWFKRLRLFVNVRNRKIDVVLKASHVVILRVGGGGTIIVLKTTYIYITFIFSCYGPRSVTAIFHNNYISMHVLDGVSHLHIK
jgi:hypothetical protein